MLPSRRTGLMRGRVSASALLVDEGGRDEQDVDDLELQAGAIDQVFYAPGEGALELVADGGSVLLRTDDVGLLVKVAAAGPGSGTRNIATGIALRPGQGRLEARRLRDTRCPGAPGCPGATSALGTRRPPRP